MPHLNAFAKFALVALAGFSAIACGTETPETRLDIQVTRSDLGARLGADVSPSGLTVDAETGHRFYLDAERGIFEELADGEVVNRWQPTPDLPRLTDLCAMGGGRFIAAADGDGYVIDIASGAARQHFCLEPEWDPDFDDGTEGQLDHLNRSVACDVKAGLIYGQPQSVPVHGDAGPVRSEISSYRLSTGVDVDWVTLPSADYHAGGMTVVDTGRLLLAAGSTLSLYEADTQRLTTIDVLADDGVQRIEAISIDPISETVQLIDAEAHELVRFPLAELGL